MDNQSGRCQFHHKPLIKKKIYERDVFLVIFQHRCSQYFLSLSQPWLEHLLITGAGKEGGGGSQGDQKGVGEGEGGGKRG